MLFTSCCSCRMARFPMHPRCSWLACRRSGLPSHSSWDLATGFGYLWVQKQQLQRRPHCHLIIHVHIAGGTAVIMHALTCPATQSFLSTRLVLYVGRVSFAVSSSRALFVFDGKCTTLIATCIRVFLPCFCFILPIIAGQACSSDLFRLHAIVARLLI